jgi:hypothetical protein
MSADPAHPGAGTQGGAPSEDELRAAYEEELNRITTAELMLQSAVSLLNLGGRRLGPPPGVEASEGQAAAAGRDLEQVRDAIEGVRALLGVLERRFSNELGPLRDALSQLQLAYARAAQDAPGPQAQRAQAPGQADGAAPAEQEPERPADTDDSQADESSSRRPGPAESSGRLWVPGR